jgi:hypothetical protein
MLAPALGRVSRVDLHSNSVASELEVASEAIAFCWNSIPLMEVL